MLIIIKKFLRLALNSFEILRDNFINFIHITSCENIVHIKTCSSVKEKELLLKLAPILFSTYRMDSSNILPTIGRNNLIFGSAKLRATKWHRARRFAMSSNKCIVIEQPIVKRNVVTLDFTEESFRVGINGFLKSECFNFGSNHGRINDSTKLEYYYNLLKPWEDQKFNVAFIIGQVPGDASLRGTNIFDWIRKVYLLIKKYYRKIIIRTPQINYNLYLIELANLDGIELQIGTFQNKRESLIYGDAFFTYSSTFSLESISIGKCTYTDSSDNFASDYCPSSSDVIFPYPYFERELLFEKIANCEFSIDDIKKLELKNTNFDYDS